MIVDFTPVFDKIVEELDPMSALVFGRIWRYAQNEGGVCYASLSRIGNDIGLSPDTVRRRIEKLMNADFLQEKEFVIGETRKFTINYDVMLSMGLMRLGVKQAATPPIAESNTKKVVKKEEIKKQTPGAIEAFYLHGNKSLILDGYPPDIQDLLQPFADKFKRIPGSQREKNTWIAGAKEWKSIGVRPDDVSRMFDHCREKGTVIKSPFSISFAFDELRTSSDNPDWRP